MKQLETIRRNVQRAVESLEPGATRELLVDTLGQVDRLRAHVALMQAIKAVGKKDLELLKGEQRSARRTRQGRGAFRRTNRFKDGGTG